MKKLLIFISILFLTLSGFAQANKTAQDYIDSGFTKYKAKRYREAIQDYNKAINIEPNNSLIYYYRGYAKEFSNKYDDAIADFNKALELETDPRNKARIQDAITNAKNAKYYREKNESSWINFLAGIVFSVFFIVFAICCVWINKKWNDFIMGK